MRMVAVIGLLTAIASSGCSRSDKSSAPASQKEPQLSAPAGGHDTAEVAEGSATDSAAGMAGMPGM